MNGPVAESLSGWLLARIAEDEEAAQSEVDLAGRVFPDAEFKVTYQWVRHTEHRSGGYGTSHVGGAPSPARVLAECEANRRIIGLHERYPHHRGEPTCVVCVETHDEDGECENETWPCETLRLLASSYADRPGWREEWRP